MEPDELGFNAWVLIGNALTLATGGTSHHVLVPNPQAARELAEGLAAVPPGEMVQALERLIPEQRLYLQGLIERCYDVLGGDAAPVLGLERGDAEEVLRMLRLP